MNGAYKAAAAQDTPLYLMSRDSFFLFSSLPLCFDRCFLTDFTLRLICLMFDMASEQIEISAVKSNGISVA